MPAAGNGLAVVRWTAPADNGGSPIERYEIRVLDSKGRQVGGLRTAGASSTAHTVTGLANGTTYRFQVRAVNAIGAGGWSAVSSMVTPRTVPGKVRDLTAQPGRSGGPLTAAVRWTVPAATGGSAITGYRLTYQRTTGRSTPIVLVLPASARSATVTAPRGVAVGARYRVTVQAVTTAGAGSGTAVTTTVR
jgi:predicted phage tail protein